MLPEVEQMIDARISESQYNMSAMLEQQLGESQVTISAMLEEELGKMRSINEHIKTTLLPENISAVEQMIQKTQEV